MTTKSFTELANGIGKLVEEKNKAYGSAFDRAGDFLKVLYPDGIKPDQYKDMLCVVRVFDKLMRIATSYEGTEEKKVDAYSDLMGYGLLGLRASLIEQEETAASRKESETPPQQTKIDPFVGLDSTRWQELAFNDAFNDPKRNRRENLGGRNRPKVTPENIAKFRMKVDEK